MVSDTPIEDFDDFSKRQHDNMSASRSPPATGRENAATRKARSRHWPELSNKPTPIVASLAQRKRELEGEPSMVVAPGKDSGRNLMVIFQDIDNQPRLNHNIHCITGRNKGHWAHFNSVADVDIPVGTTLKQMCTFYPLHCWGEVLRIFMAEGWTAEQIWRALPEPARCHAPIRPWNYLQQAMGREADKIHAEAGNGKRIPIKRKKDDSSDAEDDEFGDEAAQSPPQAETPSRSAPKRGAHPMRRSQYGSPTDNSNMPDLSSYNQSGFSASVPHHSPPQVVNQRSPFSRPKQSPRDLGFAPAPGTTWQENPHLSQQQGPVDPQPLQQARQVQYQQSTQSRGGRSSSKLSPNGASASAGHFQPVQPPYTALAMSGGHVAGQSSSVPPQSGFPQFDGGRSQESGGLLGSNYDPYFTPNPLAALDGVGTYGYPPQFAGDDPFVDGSQPFDQSQFFNNSLDHSNIPFTNDSFGLNTVAGVFPGQASDNMYDQHHYVQNDHYVGEEDGDAVAIRAAMFEDGLNPLQASFNALRTSPGSAKKRSYGNDQEGSPSKKLRVTPDEDDLAPYSFY